LRFAGVSGNAADMSADEMTLQANPQLKQILTRLKNMSSQEERKKIFAGEFFQNLNYAGLSDFFHLPNYLIFRAEENATFVCRLPQNEVQQQQAGRSGRNAAIDAGQLSNTQLPVLSSESIDFFVKCSLNIIMN
jgi:hypothetical protein